MTMKDQIYDYLKAHGAADHATLAKKLSTKEPSIRRACQQLYVEHKIQDAGSSQGHKVWKIATEPKVITDKPGWTPGAESDKEARRAEIEERALQLQGGTKLL